MLVLLSPVICGRKVGRTRSIGKEACDEKFSCLGFGFIVFDLWMFTDKIEI